MSCSQHRVRRRLIVNEVAEDGHAASNIREENIPHRRDDSDVSQFHKQFTSFLQTREETPMSSFPPQNVSEPRNSQSTRQDCHEDMIEQLNVIRCCLERTNNTLQKAVSGLQNTWKCASTSTTKRTDPVPSRHRVSRGTCVELSARMKYLQHTEECLWKSEESWNSLYNREQREWILDDMQSTFGDEYSYRDYNIAMRRSFESHRLKYRENQNKDLQLNNRKKRRSNSSRWTTMKRRERVLATDDERDMWKHVRAELMSDEEEVDGEVLLHSPTWRTPALNELIKTLDQRRMQSGAHKKLVKKRTRSDIPSSRTCPVGYPASHVLY